MRGFYVKPYFILPSELFGAFFGFDHIAARQAGEQNRHSVGLLIRQVGHFETQVDRRHGQVGPSVEGAGSEVLVNNLLFIHRRENDGFS